MGPAFSLPERPYAVGVHAIKCPNDLWKGGNAVGGQKMAGTGNGDDIRVDLSGEFLRSRLGDEWVVIGVNDGGMAQERTQLTRACVVEKTAESSGKKMIKIGISRRRKLLRKGGDGDKGCQMWCPTTHRRAVCDNLLYRPQCGQSAKTVRHNHEPCQACRPVQRRFDSLGQDRCPGRSLRRLQAGESRYLNIVNAPREPREPVVAWLCAESVDEDDSVKTVYCVDEVMFCSVVHTPER
ncbi:Uncharacterised protein [Actinomyces viscosus]|uniref:Uncharacterized protein n=1 Tax=Actinomyces viscosus TaxID=1656 RepID=A0A3S4Z057_ACTVI|nr:Uncharacterised protein [Actinomyces viscosus]